MTPIILLVGAKGSGKDTAGAVLKEAGASLVAFADPMKEFVHEAFGGTFTTEVLWGPSELRQTVWKAQWLSGAHITRRQLVESIHTVKEKYLKLWELENRRQAFGEAVGNWASHFIENVESEKVLTARWVLQTFGTEMGRAFDKQLWSRLALKQAFALLEHQSPAVVITDGRFRNELLEVKRVGGRCVLISRPSESDDSHVSETEQKSIPRPWFDHELRNDNTLEVFKGEVRALASDWVHSPAKRLFIIDRFQTRDSSACGQCRKTHVVLNRAGWCHDCFAAGTP